MAHHEDDDFEPRKKPAPKVSFERQVFKPRWPVDLDTSTFAQVPCDDKGRDGGSWLRVMVADDGDVHVSMQEWEDIKEPRSFPNPHPSIRVRTFAGGGRHLRTRQALLWLMLAMQLDAKDPGND